MLPKHQIDFFYSVLGKKIRDARKRREFSQTKFAKLIGMSRPSLVNIEKGRQRAPLHILYYIADLLELNLVEILPNKEEVRDFEMKKGIQDIIQKNSEGNLEMEKKLADFVISRKQSYG